MKKLILNLMAIAILFAFGCQKQDTPAQNEQPEGEDISIYFVYNLPLNGGSMTKASNSEVFDEFYEKIRSAELVAETYDLVLTETTTGAKYEFKGRWNNHDMVTVKTGSYRVVGTSTASGDYIQSKCSFTFDQVVDVKTSSSSITLDANYDCFLLIFTAAELSSIYNSNGENETSLFSFSQYKYAFVNDKLYKDGMRDLAHIGGTYSNNTGFKCYTGYLNFEKGKYYIYSSISGGFNVPKMEEGSDVVAITLPPENEVWYTSTTGEAINLDNYPYQLVSNTYSNGQGKFRFSEPVVSIGNYFGDRGNPNQSELFTSLIFPSSVTDISTYCALGALNYATSIIFPETLKKLGTDFIGGFGQKQADEKHMYFLSENCPEISWYSFWNQIGQLYIHYPAGSDYSDMQKALQTWDNEQTEPFEYIMVETNYSITHAK